MVAPPHRKKVSNALGLFLLMQGRHLPSLLLGYSISIYPQLIIQSKLFAQSSNFGQLTFFGNFPQKYFWILNIGTCVSFRYQVPLVHPVSTLTTGSPNRWDPPTYEIKLCYYVFNLVSNRGSTHLPPISAFVCIFNDF